MNPIPATDVKASRLRSAAGKPPARFPSMRTHGITAILLALLFGWAVFVRWQLPSTPIADPDSYGYLNPVLTSFAGGGMTQLHGRGMAYALMLRGMIGKDGNFDRITQWQRVFGVLAGVLWWGCWLLWIRWLPGFRHRFWITHGIGLAGLALFLWNSNLIAFELMIRPEGVFPFFVLAQTLLLLVFVNWRWGGCASERSWVGMVSGGAAVTIGFLCADLKPSWGLSAGIPPFVLLLGMLPGGGPGRRPASAIALVTGFALVATGRLAIPALSGWQAEQDQKSFLPKTLFTVHAPAVYKALASRPSLSPADARFLELFGDLLGQSRAQKPRKYQTLGHDPDFLFYRTSLLDELPVGGSPDARIAYMKSAYWRAWAADPAWMVFKIIRQFHLSIADGGRSVYASVIQAAPPYRRTPSAFAAYTLPDVPPAVRDGFERMLREAGTHGASADLRFRTGPPLPGFLSRQILPVLLGICLIGWPLGMTVMMALGKWRGISPAFRVYGIFWALTLGTTLTVAASHSFDQHRYVHLLAPQHSLMLFAGLALIAGAILCSRKSPLWDRERWRCSRASGPAACREDKNR